MTEIDTAEILAEHGPRDACDCHDDCRVCFEDRPCVVVRLCHALDEARLEARNLRIERDAAHREVADRTAERDEARTINAGYADQVAGFQGWLAREAAKLAEVTAERDEARMKLFAVQAALGADDLAGEVVKALRKRIRAAGGDVQVVLGAGQ